MAHHHLLSSLTILPLFLFSLSSAKVNRRIGQDLAASPVDVACKATRYPQTCRQSLSGSQLSGPAPGPIIVAAISIAANHLSQAQPMVKAILDSTKGNKNRTNAASNCVEMLGNSAYRANSSVQALSGAVSDPPPVKNARAWMGASLHLQYSCWSALSYVNDTRQVIETMTFINDTIVFSSNALSMIAAFDLFGADIANWVPPKTERQGFWPKTRPASSYKPGGVPSDLSPNATVCQDGSVKGAYKTVQEAVNAAPDYGSDKFVIQIQAGTYNETVRVPLEKTRLVFLGEGMGKTVISGDSFVQPGISTYNTATLAVVGDGFMMKGVTVQNTAGPDAHQAVAFRSDSDLSLIDNCEFLGNQDTLYAEILRQFYKSCRISGNVDFVFGNSASVFDNCTILVKPRQLKPEKGESNAVSAQGRVDPAQPTGFVFYNCLVNGTDDYMKSYNETPAVHKTYLGRPWKEYSRVVFIKCELERLIKPEGWLEWKGPFALNTLYYGELDNSGPGANYTKRVPWSSQIPEAHAAVYSPENFIQADQWIPAASS